MTEHQTPDPTAGRSRTRFPTTETRPSPPGLTPSAVADDTGAAQARRPSGVAVLQRALAATIAVLLAIDAYVHVHDAGLYDSVTTSTLSQGTLFRAQAAAAVAVAIALLIQPHPAAWAIAVLVAGSAAAAVLLYTYLDVGALGPLPNMYEPTWALAGKRESAAAEITATLLAGTGLVLSLRTVHKRSSSPDDSQMRASGPR